MPRKARNLTHNGRTQSVSDWGREIGLPSRTIYQRLRKGYSVADALYPGRILPMVHEMSARGRKAKAASPWAYDLILKGSREPKR